MSPKLPTVLIEDKDGTEIRINEADLEKYLADGATRLDEPEPEPVQDPEPGAEPEGGPDEDPEGGPEEPEEPAGPAVQDTVVEALQEAGYDTAEKINEASDEDLLGVKGVGPAVLGEVRAWAEQAVNADE